MTNEGRVRIPTDATFRLTKLITINKKPPCALFQTIMIGRACFGMRQ